MFIHKSIYKSIPYFRVFYKENLDKTAPMRRLGGGFYMCHLASYRALQARYIS